MFSFRPVFSPGQSQRKRALESLTKRLSANPKISKIMAMSKIGVHSSSSRCRGHADGQTIVGGRFVGADRAAVAAAQRAAPAFSRRKPVGQREVLTGILFVLKSGIPWEMLPQELGCGSGMTCWRRLRDWQTRGVWERIHHVLLERLHQAQAIDWSRAIADSSSVRAVGAGEKKRPQSDRPAQGGQQASPARGRRRHPFGD